jgi:hypothetical protein
VLRKILRQRSRHGVIAAARSGAENDGNGLAFVEIGGLGECRANAKTKGKLTE